jgi:hypothetical protein
MSDPLVDELVEFITARDNVSFVELERWLEEHGVSARGEIELSLTDVPNLVLWTHMSDRFAEIVEDLRTDGRVMLEPSHFLVYFIDGRVPGYPVARRPPKQGYRNPHWAPVVFKPAARQNLRPRTHAPP